MRYLPAKVLTAGSLLWEICELTLVKAI